MKKKLELNDQEIKWLLAAINAGQVENVVPSKGEESVKVRELEKKLKTLLFQKKSD
jgi:hypothetical protein